MPNASALTPDGLRFATPYSQEQPPSLKLLNDLLKIMSLYLRMRLRDRITFVADDEIKERFQVGLRSWR